MNTDILKIVIPLCFLCACKKTDPISIPLPTQINVQILHHNVPIPHLPVYFKYNTAEFPGYDDPEKWADTSVITDVNGKIELKPLPEGQHWLVATGIDSIPLPHTVYGSLPFTIDLSTRPKLDTLVYVSE